MAHVCSILSLYAASDSRTNVRHGKLPSGQRLLLLLVVVVVVVTVLLQTPGLLLSWLPLHPHPTLTAPGSAAPCVAGNVPAQSGLHTLLLLLLLLLLLWRLASCCSRRSRTSLQHSRAANVLGGASTSCCRQVMQGAVSSHSRPHLDARLARLRVSSAGALYTMSHTWRRRSNRQQRAVSDQSVLAGRVLCKGHEL
jgi:membrane protein implicated in regulation of membrane protease activity